MREKSKKIIDYRALILNATKPLDFLDQIHQGQSFKWLANEIENGKRNLKYNSVDFIVIKVLDKNNNIINLQKQNYFKVYVIGTFRNEFTPTIRVAEALAEFYLEMQVLPNIYTISKKEVQENSRGVLNRINNGILIYDRERNLH